MRTREQKHEDETDTADHWTMRWWKTIGRWPIVRKLAVNRFCRCFADDPLTSSSIMLQPIVTAWRIDRDCSRMLEHAKPDLIQATKFMVVVTSLFNLVILSFPDNMFYHVWTTTTLFKSVRSSSHEQSVPTCMDKPVNSHLQAGQLNRVKAGQLNHVQARRQAKTSCAFLRV